MFTMIRRLFAATHNDNKIDAALYDLQCGLDMKREKAIEYLGDKWILKGGAFNRNTKVLNS